MPGGCPSRCGGDNCGLDPITRRADVALWDLPAYPDATLRVQVTQPGGTAAVGLLVVGRQRKLGDERWNPKFGIEDYPTLVAHSLSA